ncbi:CAZyme family GH16 [Penicillium verhagenii]|nr:CAZyme family GH16 [Penicillium verhagenii]
MHALSTLIPTLGLFAQFTTAAYTLLDDYGTDESFFNKFDFYTSTDPTNGYVNYVDNSTATSDGLVSASGSSVYIGVDHTNVASGNGRNSVRLTSTNTYNEGLVILDLEHMPASVCGTWPAFWMLGSDWPNHGEIDIIEGVNQGTTNQMTLHTSDDCSITNSGFTGTLDTSNCYVEASGQSANSGCAIVNSDTSSYGDGFNNADGGVYATEWTDSAINIWFFANSSIPSDITSGSPDPSGWGTPAASFSGDCDISSHFSNLQIVFDITFCGDWAGDVWSSSGTCSSYASTCDDYVQNNPSAFESTYWSINSLKVYQDSTTSKRDEVPHAHAAAHANYGRTAEHIRSPHRPAWKHRRDGFKHGSGF